jgi:hypothetical protein
MNVVELPKALVDIPHVTKEEIAAGELLCSNLKPLLSGYLDRLERMQVSGTFRVAHTDPGGVPKSEVSGAVNLYKKMGTVLIKGAD